VPYGSNDDTKRRVKLARGEHTEVPDGMDETLLRVPEVARLLSVSRALAYQLVERGEIRSIRLGRSVRVDPRDLREFVERQRRVA
jgi:excisionase family DNA binding protein